MKRLWMIAMAFFVILGMMPEEAFAAQENKECICITACSKEEINEECEVCLDDFEQCEKIEEDTKEEKKVEEETTEKTIDSTTEVQNKTTKTTEKESEKVSESTTKKVQKTSSTTETKKDATKTTSTTATKRDDKKISSTTAVEKYDKKTTATTSVKKEEKTTSSTTAAKKDSDKTSETTTQISKAAKNVADEKEEAKTVETATTEKNEKTEASSATDESDVLEINSQNFPDGVFRSWIKENISGAEDGKLTQEEIEAVDSIDVSGLGIITLGGVRNFKNLVTLDCSDNSLSALVLTGLEKLESLDCSNNNLSVLDLTALNNLGTVKLDGQKVSATAVQQKDGWTVDMKEIVGKENIQSVGIPSSSNLDYDAETGIVTFEEERDQVTYTYETGLEKGELSVTLNLYKQYLEDEDEFEITFEDGKTDFGTVKDKDVSSRVRTIKIKNQNDTSMDGNKLTVKSKAEKSNFTVTIGELEKWNPGEEVTIQVSPKKELEVGEYQEDFIIQVDDEQIGEFRASIKIEHDMQTTWSYDNEKHWHSCKNCDYKEDSGEHSGEHSGTAANCVEKALCEVCKNRYGSVNPSNHKNLVKVDAKSATCTTDGNIAYWKCEGCGKYYEKEDAKKELSKSAVTVSKTGHNFVWKYDGSEHWQECSKCGQKINKAAHKLTWKYDGNQHWQVCSVCGRETSKANHTLTWKHDGNQHWQVCSVCGRETSKANHTLTWANDSSEHWQKCSTCGREVNRANHTFIWKVDQQPTATQNGSRHEECNSCGYKKAAVVIASTGTTATTVATVKATTSSASATTKAGLLSKIIPTTGDNSNIVLWISILAICAVTIFGILARYLGRKR